MFFMAFIILRYTFEPVVISSATLNKDNTQGLHVENSIVFYLAPTSSSGVMCFGRLKPKRLANQRMA